jgi:GAF domain
MRRRAKPEKAKVGAKPTGARKSRKNDGSRVRDLEKRLEEAQEQLQTRDRELAEAREQLTATHAQVTESHHRQTATSEILRVIGSSPRDLQPVFDIIAKRATELTDAVYSAVYLVEDESIHLRAYHSADIPNTRQFAAAFPMPITSATLIAGTLRTGTLAHVPDMEAVSVPETGRSLARTLGVRSTLTVPMRRDGHPIGAIGVNRRKPGRLRCSRPSPTRRSLRSRTSGCSTRRRRRSTSRRRPARFLALSPARPRTFSRCSMPWPRARHA